MENTNLAQLYYYSEDEYREQPLAFVALYDAMPNFSLTVLLLREFDQWYGDTDQDVKTWAVEYQLLARMLLNHGALILNPRYLALDEVLPAVLDILNPHQKELYLMSRRILGLPVLEYLASKPEQAVSPIPIEPEVGKEYINRNGSAYFCDGYESSGDGAKVRMKRVSDGYSLYVFNVRQYQNGEIEWDYSREIGFPDNDNKGVNMTNPLIDAVVKALPPQPRSYDLNNDPGFWTDGKQILCPTETECEAVAEFLRDLFSEIYKTDVHTGFYGMAEHEGKDYAGFYFISFD